MIAFISSLPASGLALAMGVAVGGLWLTVRTRERRERRKSTGHCQPCRRCGARN
jgi:hypothetical protein